MERKSGGGSQILYNNKKFTACELNEIDALHKLLKYKLWKTETAFAYN